MKALARLIIGVLVASASVIVPSAANAGTPAPPEVFAIGDSIFTRTGANTFGTEFPAALDANSLVSSGIDANSGRSISSNGLTADLGSGLDAVANHRSELADSDILITDLGINDTEFGADWEALVRQFIGEVKAANPDIVIAWITPVAEPGVAPQRFLDRGVDHAPIVRALADEGLIDILVEWDTYALAHRDVFHIDGVHYWQTGDTVRYTAFAAEWLADHYQPPAPEPPTPEPSITPNGPADAQILRLYRATFGRTPDTSGFDHWGRQYRRGASLEAIATEFMGSSEWASLYGSAATNTELIGLLYVNTLGRTPAASEVAYWDGRMSQGLSRAQLVISFSDSNENVARTGTATPLGGSAMRVLRLYRAALGRTPDQGGLTYWTGIAADGASLRSVASGFMGSDEWNARYGANLTNARLIELLYSNVLDRSPDASGSEYWLGRMADGMAPVDILIAFSDSNENLDRTGTR